MRNFSDVIISSPQLNSQDEENDPHRARYSTAELKEILCERDELKAQINDLASELKIYKPVDEPKSEER